MWKNQYRLALKNWSHNISLKSIWLGLVHTSFKKWFKKIRIWNSEKKLTIFNLNLYNYEHFCFNVFIFRIITSVDYMYELGLIFRLILKNSNKRVVDLWNRRVYRTYAMLGHDKNWNHVHWKIILLQKPMINLRFKVFWKWHIWWLFLKLLWTIFCSFWLCVECLRFRYVDPSLILDSQSKIPYVSKIWEFLITSIAKI